MLADTLPHQAFDLERAFIGDDVTVGFVKAGRRATAHITKPVLSCARTFGSFEVESDGLVVRWGDRIGTRCLPVRGFGKVSLHDTDLVEECVVRHVALGAFERPS